jgi:glycosyltransferase involved in cell wall biosynthesis
MHVVFVETGYPRASGQVGGAGTYVQLFGKQLIRRGVKVSVICGQMGNKNAEYNDDGIRIFACIHNGPIHYYISKIPFLSVFAPLIKQLEAGWIIYKKLIEINRKRKINVVEYSEGGDFWNAIFKKFDYFVHLHGSAYTFKKNSGQTVNLSDWIARKVEHYFIKRAKYVISPCNAMIKLVEDEMGETFDNSEVIPYPIDEKQINHEPEEQKIVRKEKVIIFFASRNDPVKGGEFLIDALKQIPASLKDFIEVKFYGYEPVQDVSNLNFLEQHKFVPKEVLLEAYKSADICVIPSYFDNSPNTVYEAMGAGKIIVASAVGGIPELIGNNECGFLFKPRDIDDFKDKFLKAIYLVLEQEHFAMGQAARKRILALINLDFNTERRIRLIGEFDILDLGCGTNKVEDAIGMDNAVLDEVDVVHDLLDFPYPFRDGSFDHIYLRHVVEHFSLDNIQRIFSECRRILKSKGKIHVHVPHAFSIAAFTDITHKSFFVFRSGDFWDVNNTKNYYKEIESMWYLISTNSYIVWHDWKKYRLKKLDNIMSTYLTRKVNAALQNKNNPSHADRLIKKFALQFVEIQWVFQKTD